MLNLGPRPQDEFLAANMPDHPDIEAGEIEIREMRLEDLDDVLWVEQSSFRTPWTRTMFEDEFKNPVMAHYLIARSGEHVVGYMGFWLIQKEAHITNLAVHPAFRRRKIGSAPLRAHAPGRAPGRRTRHPGSPRRQRIRPAAL